MGFYDTTLLLAHEIQVAENIHLSDASLEHIERLMYQAVYQENQEIARNRDYWKEMYFAEKEKGK